MSDIAKQALSALQGAAAGAAGGAALGPIGAAAGGAIGIATALLPGVAHLLVQAEPQVQQVVERVTGTADPAQQALIAANPQVEADLRVQLAQIAADRQADANNAMVEQIKAEIADTESARAQTLSLAQIASPIAWGAPTVSLVVSLGFFATMAMIAFAPQTADQGRQAMLYILVGVLGSTFNAVVSYWVGSSSGSKDKDSTIAGLALNSVPARMLPKPAKIEPAT